HAVAENIGHAGGVCRVDIDMDRIVVTGGAREQRQRGARNRGGPHRRQGVTDSYAAVHRGSSCRMTAISVSSATIRPSGPVTVVARVRNSSAPPFFWYTSVMRPRAVR